MWIIPCYSLPLTLWKAIHAHIIKILIQETKLCVNDLCHRLPFNNFPYNTCLTNKNDKNKETHEQIVSVGDVPAFELRVARADHLQYPVDAHDNRQFKIYHESGRRDFKFEENGINGIHQYRNYHARIRVQTEK